MDLNLNGKKALITGAGRGIGKEIALKLSEEGARTVIISKTQKDLESVLEKMGGVGSGSYTICCDLTNDDSPKKVFYEIKEKFGDLDIVINNLGGTLGINDPFCSIEDWKRVWRTNMEVAIELNNLFIPSMIEKKWGRIVNISSISSLENHGPVPYCSVKAALTSYTRSMGRMLAKDGVVMNAVLPGAVITGGGYWDIMSKTNPEYVKKYLDERMAVKRFGNPKEISSMVAYLCSENASFCVGSVFPIDGGQGRCFF